ncbi:sugar kinase [Micromonospora sp. KC606]|uniref:sugar kinase n=1 Tax=Micromonospora sp. KC606 TaxID=2530379 RepID=UPI00104A4368|nr:sugar kinase [Micromonospora sp. KC606]TDC81615.1 sugar kinase [Micromonospora sp. KC606]
MTGGSAAGPDRAVTGAGGPTAAAGPTGGPEVATVGEAMVVLTPDPMAPLERADRLGVSVGGAESNLAIALAGLGHRVGWVSRVGDDPFGRRVVRHVTDAGVDALVEVDPTAPTGVYLKDPGPGGTAVHYYRSGSAASALGPDALDDRRLAGVRLLHLSGVTAALSPTCAALVKCALTDRPLGDARISFDVNHRARLWPVAAAAPVLRRLADRADVVLVGQDEADTLWGCADPVAVRALLPGPDLVVVKDAAVGATVLPRTGTAVFVPALRVPVREPVGAGDAFAAGFLSGLLRDLEPRDCLRLGHLCAAPTLTVPGDTAPPPGRALVDRLLALPAAAWAQLDPVGAGLLPGTPVAASAAERERSGG